MKYKIIFCIVLILILFGCTEMTQSEKNLCYSFTTRSYDYIPTCITEESCYAKVDALFQTNLAPTQETKLYEIKNKIGRSWFYYNKAIQEMKKISTQCKNGVVSALPSTINQMNFYLEKAFLELDNGTRDTFEIINLQEQTFTSQDIDLLKEEKIYESLLELRQILSELENGPTNSNSYISYYLEQVNNFNKNNSGAYYPVIEKNTFWLSTYHIIDDLLLEKIGLGKKGHFPFLTNYFKQTVDYLEFNLYKTESLKALQSFPASEFMLLYSKLGGEKNSSLQRFSDLLNKVSINYILLINKKEGLIAEVNQLEGALLEKYSTITQDPIKLFIKSKLLASKITPKIDYLNQINSLKTDHIALNEKRAQGKITIGKEFSELKKLRTGYILLSRSIEENVFNEEENLVSACTTYARTIEKQLTNKEPLQNYINEIEYLITKTKTKNDLQLNYCKKLILTNEEYELGLKNYEELESKKIDLTKDCFSYLKTIFEYTSFYEIENLFNELEQTTVNSTNLFFFEDACENLQKQINYELNSDPELEEILSSLIKTNNLFEEINQNIIYFEKDFQKDFEKKYKTFNLVKNSIYTAAQIDFSKLLPIKNDFKFKIKNTYETLKPTYLAEVINFVQSNILIEVVGNTIPLAGTKQQLQKKLILNNPFHDIDQVFFITLPFNGTIFRKETNLIDPFENKISFDNLSKGKHGFDLNTYENILLIESIKPILITNNNSIFQKTIELDSINSYPKIIIQTQKMVGTYKTILFKNGLEQQHSEIDSNIIFVGEVKSGEKLTYYFYISNLIKSNYNLTQSYQTNSATIEKFKITMQNTTDLELNATLTLPIKYNNSIDHYSLIDEKSKNLKVSVLNDEFIVENNAFLPKQVKEYYLTLQINDVYLYYHTLLENALNKLNSLGEMQISAEITIFLEVLEGKNYAKDAEILLKKAQAKIESLNKEKLSESELLIAKKRLEAKISELKETLQNANKFNITNTTQLEELLKSALLSVESDDESNILATLSNIEKFEFVISEELIEDVEKMWKEINEIEVLPSELFTLKESFFEQKQIFDSYISHDLEKGYAAYENLKELFSDFLKTKAELQFNLETNEKELTNKITILKDKLLADLNFLTNELNVSEEDLIKAKFVPPITKSRLKKINLELIGIDSLSLANQEKRLFNFSKELQEAIDYLKTKTIDEYNFAIEKNAPSAQLRKAKTYIDNNNYLSAYLALQETYAESSSIPYFIIPILLIVIIGLVLKYKLKNEKTKSNSKKTDVEKDWN